MTLSFIFFKLKTIEKSSTAEPSVLSSSLLPTKYISPTDTSEENKKGKTKFGLKKFNKSPSDSPKKASSANLNGSNNVYK